MNIDEIGFFSVKQVQKTGYTSTSGRAGRCMGRCSGGGGTASLRGARARSTGCGGRHAGGFYVLVSFHREEHYCLPTANSDCKEVKYTAKGCSSRMINT